MRDLSAFHLDDRAEPVVVFRISRDDCPMDLIFDHDRAAVGYLVDNQLISGVKRDDIDVRLKLRLVRPLIKRGQPGTS